MIPDSMDQEIAQAQARNRELANQRNKLANQFQSTQRRVAYLSHLYDRQRLLEKEIAALEGRPYHDDQDPYQEPPQPPDDEN